MPELTMLIFWVVVLVVLIVVEALTAQLVTIWWAVGAVGALIAERLGAEIWLQWIIFIAISALTLIATRPLVKKLTKAKAQPTNADRCIGETAVVKEEINNLEGKGQVYVNGITWSARTADGAVIPVDSKVTVEKIDGVKLIVKAQ